MAAISLILIIQKIFQLPTPSQSLGLRFSECRRKWNISVDHYEKLKNGYHFFKYHTEKFPITDPPQKMAAISCVDINGISADTGMQIFIFLNFLLVHFPPSPILGCISTFMHRYM